MEQSITERVEGDAQTQPLVWAVKYDRAFTGKARNKAIPS